MPFRVPEPIAVGSSSNWSSRASLAAGSMRCPGDQGRADWPDVRDRPQPLLPYPQWSDYRRRVGCDKRGKDSHRRPVVTKANADAMLWMEEQFLI
jgi:hypothetical protein